MIAKPFSVTRWIEVFNSSASNDRPRSKLCNWAEICTAMYTVGDSGGLGCALVVLHIRACGQVSDRAGGKPGFEHARSERVREIYRFGPIAEKLEERSSDGLPESSTPENAWGGPSVAALPAVPPVVCSTGSVPVGHPAGRSTLLLLAKSGKSPSHTRRGCARTAADAKITVLRR